MNAPRRVNVILADPAHVFASETRHHTNMGPLWAYSESPPSLAAGLGAAAGLQYRHGERRQQAVGRCAAQRISRRAGATDTLAQPRPQRAVAASHRAGAGDRNPKPTDARTVAGGRRGRVVAGSARRSAAETVGGEIAVGEGRGCRPAARSPAGQVASVFLRVVRPAHQVNGRRANRDVWPRAERALDRVARPQMSRPAQATSVRLFFRRSAVSGETVDALRGIARGGRRARLASPAMLAPRLLIARFDFTRSVAELVDIPSADAHFYFWNDLLVLSVSLSPTPCFLLKFDE